MKLYILPKCLVQGQAAGTVGGGEVIFNISNFARVTHPPHIQPARQLMGSALDLSPK
jgi:hypothetical protein